MDGDAVLGDVERALVAHFGTDPVRASVSFVGVEPIDILRFEPGVSERVYVSLGMARHPMSEPGLALRSPSGPRAELLLHLRDPADVFADVWRALAVLAAAPVVEGVVYVAGMTVDVGAPLAPGSRCTGVVTDASAVPPIDTGGGPVGVFQVIPAPSQELAWCRVHGASALMRRWHEHGTNLLDLARGPVRLD